MRKCILSIIILIAGVLYSVAEEIPVKSKVINVTVFPGSAQLTRSASFTAVSGVNEIIFENVSSFVNTSSIQAKGKGNFTILDVKFRYKQPEIIIDPQEGVIPPKVLKEIALLEDSLAYLNFDLSELYLQIDAFNMEKTILTNNQLVKGHGGDTITELKATMEYFRVKINDINTNIQKLRKQEFGMKKQLSRMSARLDDLKAYNQQQNPVNASKSPIPQIIVIISCDAAVNGSIDISYMVTNAGWTPTYDLKTNGIDQPVQLVYKADVWQSTGEDWENSRIKLSTITPSANNIKPVLPVFYLNYYNYYVTSTINTREESGSQKYKDDKAMSGANEGAYLDADYAYNYTNMVQTMTNVEFDIKLPYTIPSDGQIHILPVQSESLPTTYVYHIVPKLESQAFLIAKITDWQKLDLLPGKANIYFDGTFVGETQINPYTVSDTLDLALGRDRSLQIQRKQIKNETNKKLVGSICTKTITYEITVKNTKMVKTEIVLQDNIPLSLDEEIKVLLTDKGKATWFESTGLLQWGENIAANETKKFTYTFTVEYDSAKSLNSGF
ncbi:MAG: DUF4139 domain-containing protein [Bacteroidales bacterium]|nr:DUF4139 domain-containing protein [Bacteroidales bacterium]MDD3858718.1 DUF4139 domain-containing protein [Bacteroidales bacterium]